MSRMKNQPISDTKLPRKMTSRERLRATLNHQEPDRVTVDLGSTGQTGIGAGALTRLRKAVLHDDVYRVKVFEPLQMLGEVDSVLHKKLQIDVAGVFGPTTLFGYRNDTSEKPFTLNDGTKVLVPEGFQTDVDEDGSYLIYPEGDRSVAPRGRMPVGGDFFTALTEQPPINEADLNPADNCEEFGLLSDAEINYYAQRAKRLTEETDCGVVLNVPGTAFGDIALVPAPWMKSPRGIRDEQEWYISLLTRSDYIHAVFERQCDIAVQNVERLIAACEPYVDVAALSGTDFGTQDGLFCSLDLYRVLFKPYQKRINDLIHEKSDWKTFLHTCGAVSRLIPDLIEAGFDILNPVQCSAKGMDPNDLKREFGEDIVFWGGGVDTQKTLPFGTPEEVYREVRERIDIFSDGGGFVFCTVHNILNNSPTENILAIFRAVHDSYQ